MDNGIRIYNGEIDEEDDSPEIKERRVSEGLTLLLVGVVLFRMPFQWLWLVVLHFLKLVVRESVVVCIPGELLKVSINYVSMFQYTSI